MAAGRTDRHRLLIVALLLASCDGGSALAPREALELVSPHVEHFDGFERWARRALAADPAFRSPETLEETVFAPIRREEPVVAVWIERESPERRLVYGHIDAPPKRAEWVRVRDETLGSIDVTTAKIPDPRRRFREGEGDRSVLVRRTGRGTDGATVTVTVAYRVDQSGDG